MSKIEILDKDKITLETIISKVIHMSKDDIDKIYYIIIGLELCKSIENDKKKIRKGNKRREIE